MLDSGLSAVGDDSGDSGAAGFDGTTGKPCTSDVDCISDGGPGINTCSSDYAVPRSPTSKSPCGRRPVCILPPPMSSAQGNCDPVPGGVDDGLPHFCDGPDDPTSPGLCLPFSQNNPQPGEGVCYPLCTFALDGTKATGMRWHRQLLSGHVPAEQHYGNGHRVRLLRRRLSAGRRLRAAGDRLRLPDRYRLLHDGTKVTRTKAIGAACSTTNAAGMTVGTTDDATTGACNCDADPTTGEGICSTACTVGGAPCQDGWTCDAGYPNPLVFMSSAGGAAINVPVTAQNIGSPGTCRPICMLAGCGRRRRGCRARGRRGGLRATRGIRTRRSSPLRRTRAPPQSQPVRRTRRART